MTNSAGYIYNNKFDGHTELKEKKGGGGGIISESFQTITDPPLRELVYTHEQQRYTDIYTHIYWLITSRVLSSFEL